MNENNLNIAVDLMNEFAEITGLSTDKKPKRYLWTDAFAVCNYLAIYQKTKEEKFKELALKLIDQVHSILGKYREDDHREGWISGLSEEEGAEHPTIGGLRIGKEKPERKQEDNFDQQLEWERDGQYYHYLTKWMYALHRVSEVTGDPKYNFWGIELAKTAHSRFTYQPSFGGSKRMYWKMSTDLSYPLVPSMGQHDPVDGYTTYLELENQSKNDEIDLKDELVDMKRIKQRVQMVTEDSLGIGGLLIDAARLARVIGKYGVEEDDFLNRILRESNSSLEMFAKNNQLDHPVMYRLGFRELGLSIGLHSVINISSYIENNLDRFINGEELIYKVNEVQKYNHLIEKIEKFWLKEENRKAATWLDHREINMVMLVTSLLPSGFLGIDIQ